MSETTRNRYAERTLPLTLALAAPAVRMVFVEVCACRGDDGEWDAVDDHAVYPVLAVIASHGQNYSQKLPPGGPVPACAPTHDALLDLGWWADPYGPDLTFDVLVNDADLGLSEGGSPLRPRNAAREVVVCDWPREEDTVRLAPVIERLRARARADEDTRRRGATS